MKSGVRVGINGFGRIGRALMRVMAEMEGVEVVAVNDLAQPSVLAHLFRYDSVHGKFAGEVEVKGDLISVGSRETRVLRVQQPALLPWKDLDVDLVFECTGEFTDERARDHLAAGAKRVIISAPCAYADFTVVMGVNQERFDPARHLIVSNASCTTNCLAPVAKTIHEAFGIEKGLVTTIHAYTNDQKLLDHAHHDLRRARAANLSMIPTTTGAAAAVGLVLPELAGKLDGVSVRVPAPDVSLADITLSLSRAVDPAAVNRALSDASEGLMRGILHYTDEPLVSADYRGTTYSAVVDGAQTRVVGGNLVKISAWYDNEWGYANRLADLMTFIRSRT